MKVYKELMQPSINEIYNFVFKMAKDLNKHFSKEDIKIANRYLKSCAKSIFITETRINTTSHLPEYLLFKRKNIRWQVPPRLQRKRKASTLWVAVWIATAIRDCKMEAPFFRNAIQILHVPPGPLLSTYKKEIRSSLVKFLHSQFQHSII